MINTLCQPCTSHRLSGVEIKHYTRLNIQEIIEQGCLFLNTDLTEVLGRTRKIEVVDTRFMIMNYLRAELKFKDEIIGKFFKRDRTSVIHSSKAVYSLCFTEPEYKKKYLSLTEFLNTI